MCKTLLFSHNKGGYNASIRAICNFFRRAGLWSRKKASVVNCLFLLAASMPCVLGYNVWKDLRLIGGRDVLDSEDFLG